MEPIGPKGKTMRTKRINKAPLVIATLALVVLLIGSLPTRASEDYEHLYSDTEAQRIFMESKFHEYFPEPGLAEAVIELADCESTGLIHWLPDGTLRPNIPKKGRKQTSAGGVMQVLLSLHRKDYRRLGLDMYDIDDYMKYVRHLYDTQGPANAWDECVVQLPDTVVAVLKQYD